MTDPRCERCYAILPRHYYPCNPTRMTQVEVAQAMGITVWRVDRLEKSALRKLRAGLAAWRPEA